MAAVHTPDQVAALCDCEKNLVLYPFNHRRINDSSARALGLGLTAHDIAQATAQAQQINNYLLLRKQFPVNNAIPGPHIHNQADRDAAIVRNRENFLTLFNNSRLLIKRCSVDDFRNGNTAGITVFPSLPVNHARLNIHSARAQLARNSSCVYDTIFTASTNYGGSNIGDSAQWMRLGGGAWHANEQTANYVYNGAVPHLTMEPIGIQTAIHGIPGVGGPQFHPFWDSTTRHTNAHYNNGMAQLWHPAQDLQSPPLTAALRNLPAYRQSNGNMETVLTWQAYRHRIHDNRSQQLVDHAWRCIIPDLNPYFGVREGLHAVKPGLLLSDNHLISQCHYYNKVLSVLPSVQPPFRRTSAWVLAREYEAIRSAYVLNRHVNPWVENYVGRRDRLLEEVTNYSNFRTSGNDVPAAHKSEVGKFAYASANLLQSLEGHMRKQHRRKFNMPGYGLSDGFQEGIRAYQFDHRELHEACYEAISSTSAWGLEHIVKCRFPMIPFAAWNVINGPAETPFTDMIIIKDYDCFRPMEEAEVWWFEVLDEPFDWSLTPADDDDDKKPAAKRPPKEDDESGDDDDKKLPVTKKKPAPASKKAPAKKKSTTKRSTASSSAAAAFQPPTRKKPAARKMVGKKKKKEDEWESDQSEEESIVSSSEEEEDTVDDFVPVKPKSRRRDEDDKKPPAKRARR